MDESLALLVDQDSQFLVPYVAEAAAAMGHDITDYPRDNPLLLQLELLTQGQLDLNPPDNASLLRPTAAWIRAGAPTSLVMNAAATRIDDAWTNGTWGHAGLQNDDVWAFFVTNRSGGATFSPQFLAQTEFAWAWDGGQNPDIDTTAMVVWSGAPMTTMQKVEARKWLIQHQNLDGGWPYKVDQVSNCNSSVWAATAISNATVNATTKIFLQDLRQPDGGYSLRPNQTSNALCTAEVVTWLASQTRDQLDPDAGQTIPLPGAIMAAFVVLPIAFIFRYLDLKD